MKKPQKSGRLVLNHSTHIPGLLPFLKRLVAQPGIQTITPGRLARVKGRPTPFRIKISVPVSGGYKLQARSKGGVQEVFVVTALSAAQLQNVLDRVKAT